MTLEWQTVSAPCPEGLFAESSVTFSQIELPQAQRGLISEEVTADTAAEAGWLPPSPLSPPPHLRTCTLLPPWWPGWRAEAPPRAPQWRCVWTGAQLPAAFSWVLVHDDSLGPCPLLVSVCTPLSHPISRLRFQRTKGPKRGPTIKKSSPPGATSLQSPGTGCLGQALGRGAGWFCPYRGSGKHQTWCSRAWLGSPSDPGSDQISSQPLTSCATPELQVSYPL